MAGMYKKVNEKENVIGWYAVKKTPHSIDFEMNKIFMGYNNNPVFILFWMEKNYRGFFLEAFSGITKNPQGQKYFKTLPIGIGMLESEEIGVFQILRDSDKKFKNRLHQTSYIWIQIFRSFFKFLKKNFLKAASFFNFSKKKTLDFPNLKKLLKKTSSFYLEKKILENNLFFLYSATLLKILVSIEKILKIFLLKN